MERLMKREQGRAYAQRDTRWSGGSPTWPSFQSVWKSRFPPVETSASTRFVRYSKGAIVKRDTNYGSQISDSNAIQSASEDVLMESVCLLTSASVLKGMKRTPLEGVSQPVRTLVRMDFVLHPTNVPVTKATKCYLESLCVNQCVRTAPQMVKSVWRPMTVVAKRII